MSGVFPAARRIEAWRAAVIVFDGNDGVAIVVYIDI